MQFYVCFLSGQHLSGQLTQHAFFSALNPSEMIAINFESVHVLLTPQCSTIAKEGFEAARQLD